MDCEEQPPTSNSMIDHSYMSGEYIEQQENEDEEEVQEILTYDSNSLINGNTFIQLDDGSIMMTPQGSLIQLDDGSFLKVDNGNMIEVANDHLFKYEDGSFVAVDKTTGTSDGENCAATSSSGYYIELGNQLLFVENDSRSTAASEVPNEVGFDEAELGTEAGELQWEDIKEEKCLDDELSLDGDDSSGQTVPVAVIQWNGMSNSAETVTWKTLANKSSGAGKTEIYITPLANHGELMSENKVEKLESLYNCKECNVEFDNEKDLWDHKKDHHMNQPKSYLCDICGQAFLHLSSFRSHKAGHDPDGQTYKCDICGKKFITLNHVKEHLKQHLLQGDKSLDKIYKCDICNAKFIYSSNLSRHRKAHSENKSHVCEVCGKGFFQKSNLRSHQQLHSMTELQQSAMASAGKYRRPKQFWCKLCDKGFANQSGLKNHEDALHAGKRPHVCQECGKSFTLLSCLKTHVSTIHSETKHLCQICGKDYRNANYLKLHLKIHSGKKDFPCELCSKAFVDNPSLKLHMRTHTGEKPYRCDECGRAFTQQAHLKTHKRTHTGEKPYKCAVCEKAFRQLSNKIEHERIHKKKFIHDLVQ